MVTQNEERTLKITLSFSHPMEGIGMKLVKPANFEVIINDEKKDLTGLLKQTKVMDQMAWQAAYKLRRPGVYTFVMEPQPYWEPTEDVFIIHYTKTVVTAFGDEEGWESEIGLETEIVPLSRPYGLYAGNVFQGLVKLDGKAVPHAMVEVEYFNREKKVNAPSPEMITQTIKADQNGVFTYAAPASGWWGFAALNKADFTLPAESGEQKEVEVGAVIWVHFEEWK